MSNTLYFYRSCTSCRNAEAHLRESHVPFDTREFFKERLTREELEDVLQRAGMKPSELVSRRSKVFRNEGLGEAELTEDDWLERMISEPTLIRRPILVTDDRVVVGYSRKQYEALLSRSKADQD